MNSEIKLQISKIWSTIKSMKREIKMLNEKIDKFSEQKLDYESDDDFYDEDVVRKYLKPTDIKNEEQRYIEL